MLSISLLISVVSLKDINKTKYSQILMYFAYSATHGIGAHLLKAGSKRRRTKAEIQEAQNMEVDSRAADRDRQA